MVHLIVECTLSSRSLASRIPGPTWSAPWHLHAWGVWNEQSVLSPWRSVAAVHPGGAGTSRTARELQQDPLESHEVSGRGERGEVHLQIHSAADGTLSVSANAWTVYKLREQQGSSCWSWRRRWIRWEAGVVVSASQNSSCWFFFPYFLIFVSPAVCAELTCDGCWKEFNLKHVPLNSRPFIGILSRTQTLLLLYWH